MSISIHVPIKCALHDAQLTRLRAYMYAHGLTASALCVEAYQCLEARRAQAERDVMPWHVYAAPLQSPYFEADVPEDVACAMEALGQTYARDVSDVWYTALHLYMEQRVALVEVKLCLSDQVARLCRMAKAPDLLDQAVNWYFHKHKKELIPALSTPSTASPKATPVRMVQWTSFVSSSHISSLPEHDLDAWCQEMLVSYFAEHPFTPSDQPGLCVLEVSESMYRTIRFLMLHLHIKSVAALYERAVAWWMEMHHVSPKRPTLTYYARPKRTLMEEGTWSNVHIVVSPTWHAQVVDVAQTESQPIRTVYYTILIDYMHHIMSTHDECAWMFKEWRGQQT